MSRLYLIVVLLFASLAAFGQKELDVLLKAGEDQYKKGDYVYALSFYERAMEVDSNIVNVLWQYAETLRAYKDYRKAEYYYGKVYEKENTKMFPASILMYGLMQKQNGKYESALKTFKQAAKKYNKDKKGYLYLKAKKEIESTTWALSNVKFEDHVIIDLLPEEVNTPNSEFGHTIYDNQLYFSSLRGDSVSQNEEIYATTYKTKIYASELKDEKYQKDTLVEPFSFKNLNSGNGAFSLDGKRYYFSICSDESFKYKCKIAVANYNNGKFTDIDTLGDIINESDANTSMPCIANLDGREVLFFSSDRNKDQRMNIYYSFIKNGNQFGPVLSLDAANTIEDEISPFWDDKKKRLYFSSTWHNGFGGFDVFYCQYEGNRFTEPFNAGQPTNSPANDNYFFTYRDSSYVSSNRLGVNYSKNPTCCSDIFVMYSPIRYVKTPKETLVDLNKRLPVTLYFHNDWPDPKTTVTTTKINYIDNYRDYRALLPTYKKEYSNGLTGEKAEEAAEDIESFFVEYVDQGVKDLELFRDLMLEELDKGVSLELTIKGFASPLAKTDYNVNLTKRRISSLKNYLANYDGGVFSKYLNGTAPNGAVIRFKEIPFGEYTAQTLVSDNLNDLKNSVYSRAASLERKIEIQSVSIISKDSSNVIDTDMPIKHFGKINGTDKVTAVFRITNVSDGEVNFQKAEIECSCITLEYSKDVLKPGEVCELKVILDPKGKTGNLVQAVQLKTIESNLKEKLVITAEINP